MVGYRRGKRNPKCSGAIMKITYLYRYPKAERPAFIAVVFNYGAWRHGSLVQKGYDKAFVIAARESTTEDIEALHPYRENSFVYHSWEVLLKDERLFGASSEFITRLEELSLEYPLQEVQP